MLKNVTIVFIAMICVVSSIPHVLQSDAFATFRTDPLKRSNAPRLLREGFQVHHASLDDAPMNETVHRVPVTVPLWNGDKRTGEMVVTAYKPDGPGPFPTVIHHHGTDPEKRAFPKRYRQYWYAQYWVSRGFAVFAVTRLGFGDTGLEPFPELIRGPCADPDFATAYDALAEQSRAALSYVRGLPYVHPDRIILTGQSRGGSAVLAHIGQGDTGILGGINFAGAYQYNEARNRREECGRTNAHALNRSFGKRARAPTLWIFGEDDQVSPLDIAEDRFAAFRTGGGQGVFKIVPKQHALDGHFVITRPKLWSRDVDRFVSDLGLPVRPGQLASRN
ncbi:MAG: hypothetical protein AAFO75_01295 [Pseudomonadota bacterium]